MNIIQCTGEGQGCCKRCSDNGKWNRVWMPFLYEIEGHPGCYCIECVKDIISEVENMVGQPIQFERRVTWKRETLN